MNICVLAEDSSQITRAERLALRLEVELSNCFFQAPDWKRESKRLRQELARYEGALLVHARGLSFLPLHSLMSPIFIDFSNTAWSRRLFNISSQTELAAKALGIKKGNDTFQVFDANAGLGQDSFVFSALGAKVTACERSLLVYLLLKDALLRARLDTRLVHIVERINLIHEDSRVYLEEHAELDVDAIFLDPMFPEKKNQALAKKEMQVFQNILGADTDAEQLFHTALHHVHAQTGAKRLVLKRPKLAAILKEEAMGHQVIGKATRFDVYFK